MSEPIYSDEEAKEILKLAFDRPLSGTSGLNRGELIAAAAELGVDAQAVDNAIALRERARPVELEVRGAAERRQRQLRDHAVTYAIINGILLAINLLAGGGWWFFWPALGWGLGLALHAKNTFFRDPERDRRRAERTIDQRQQKALQDARRMQRKYAVDQFVESAEQGALAAMERVAQRLRGDAAGQGRHDPRGPRPR